MALDTMIMHILHGNLSMHDKGAHTVPLNSTTRGVCACKGWGDGSTSLWSQGPTATHSSGSAQTAQHSSIVKQSSPLNWPERHDCASDVDPGNY